MSATITEIRILFAAQRNSSPLYSKDDVRSSFCSSRFLLIRVSIGTRSFKNTSANNSYLKVHSFHSFFYITHKETPIYCNRDNNSDIAC